MKKPLTIALFVLIAAGPALAQQGLRPAPTPTENPLTEEKRVLGKILFWDEQLSSDDTVACGTCHQPASGGADPRVAVNPGPDGNRPSPDDILGSFGVSLVDSSGQPVEDEVFGFGVQVTGRASMAVPGAAYAREAFWDGRAGTTFADPETGAPSIATGGALENQAIGPILSSVEMAHEGRTWTDVTTKLALAQPLAGATDVPDDVRAALAGGAGYPDLFLAAFGDPAITAERIAFALATYERTLIPDRTPWDRFIAGDPAAMTQGQIQGWNFFRASPCSACHAPPTFSDQSFRNIGLRPAAEDPGRQDVTGAAIDAGRFKVPTLRNVGLKPNHMHNGRIPDVTQAVRWYRPNNPQRFNDNLDPLLPVGVPQNVEPALVDFITNGLTDPRVAAETFPFDRPTLHAGALPRLVFSSPGILEWPALDGVLSYNVYRGDLSALRGVTKAGLPAGGYGQCISQTDADPADTSLADATIPPEGTGFFYLKTAVDASGAESSLGVTSAGALRFALVNCP